MMTEVSDSKPNQQPPTDAVQRAVLKLWVDVLGVTPIGVHDNFFRLGGDSIQATQVVAHIRDQYQVEIPLAGFFQGPTIAALCQAIDDAKRSGTTGNPLPEIGERPHAQRLEAPLSEKTQLSRSAFSKFEDRTESSPMPFSLFFFSADGSSAAEDKYRLLLESTKFADRQGFAAVWTPERHFSPFGGLYPNPSVISAALAMITERIRIRAGSVVLPLQNPLRVAEEWSVVDNLSHGRVEIACASGWHANDFVLSPADYDDRRNVMMQRIDVIRQLWRGETIRLPNGAGGDVNVRIYPSPLQPELAIWLAGHSDQTFINAGKIGANIVTNVWKTTFDEIARQIALYRRSLAEYGHDPQQGRVAFMLHTYIGESLDEVRETVASAYGDYLSQNLELQQTRKQGGRPDFDPTEGDKSFLVSNATEELFSTRGLVGTRETCREIVTKAAAIGVDEIACLIDFGIDFDVTMASLERLAQLKDKCQGTKARVSS